MLVENNICNMQGFVHVEKRPPCSSLRVRPAPTLRGSFVLRFAFLVFLEASCPCQRYRQISWFYMGPAGAKLWGTMRKPQICFCWTLWSHWFGAFWSIIAHNNCIPYVAGKPCGALWFLSAVGRIMIALMPGYQSKEPETTTYYEVTLGKLKQPSFWVDSWKCYIAVQTRLTSVAVSPGGGKTHPLRSLLGLQTPFGA